MKIRILKTVSFDEGTIIFHQGAILQARKDFKCALVTIGEEGFIFEPSDFEELSEPKTYTEKEVIDIRSEWEKKYNELLVVKDSLANHKVRLIDYQQSLERKNKLLEEEMKHIEDDLTFFHGTEFDRDTELAEIVNSLVLEVDRYRKKEKELQERRSIVIPSSGIYEPSKHEELKGDKGSKVDEGSMVEGCIPIPLGHKVLKRPTTGPYPVHFWISERITVIKEYIVQCAEEGNPPHSMHVAELLELKDMLDRANERLKDSLN